MPAHCLESVLAHLPDARAPLAGEHAWHALVELTGSALDDAQLRALAEKVLMAGVEAGLVEDATLRDARLALALATRQVLANGLDLLGVSAPETM